MKSKILYTMVAGGVCVALYGQMAQAAGDSAEGKKKFYSCAGCHGIPGYDNTYPSYPVPKLGGQNEEFVVSALKAYKIGDRKHGSMEGNAVGWTDQDLQDIAVYLAKFRSIKESEPVTGNVAQGKTKSAACASCHGEDGNTETATFPRLAAQYEGYLIKALKDYKKGARKNAMMNSIAASLSEEDMKDIAAYYASQKKGLTVVQD